MNILITGGLGFIGSHTIVELSEQADNIIIVDNLSNTDISVLDKLLYLTNKKITFYDVDIRDKQGLNNVFKTHSIDTVMHFAGLKAVAESVKEPILYYDNNVYGSINLFNLMRIYGVKKIVFSSSATVYAGNPIPYDEVMEVGKAFNPYGETKIVIENILKDICVSDPTWAVAILRYFNPVGAHSSGLIGENPKGIPNNLAPILMDVASGKRKILQIFGDDYPTPDGTPIRDYLHVVDLAKGHVSALNYMKDKSGYFIWNLGSGHGYSVSDVIRTFEDVTGVKVNHEFAPRRDGDLPMYWANVDKAKKELGWKATKGLDDMLRDMWNFRNNIDK